MENEDLTCIVCYEIFDEPVCIPCGHTFCRVCIEETIKRTQKCPLCACPYFNDLHFKTNITVKKIIEKLNEKNIDKNDIKDLKEIFKKKKDKEKAIKEEKEENKEENKEEEKEEEINYENLLGFQLSKISPFFKGTLYEIKIENHFNRDLFNELSKNSMFIGYYTKDDKIGVIFNIRLIKSVLHKYITLIVDCLGKARIKSFEDLSFKNNEYFLQHNLLYKDEELILTKIRYVKFERVSNNLVERFTEKLTIINKKAAYFYNKLKLYNEIEYGILGQRHKVFILNARFSLDYKQNLDDYNDFLCSALNFSNKKKLVLYQSEDIELKINMIYNFLKDISLDHNAVFIFFIKDKLENHNQILLYVLLLLIGFVIYKNFIENNNSHYYYN